MQQAHQRSAAHDLAAVDHAADLCEGDPLDVMPLAGFGVDEGLDEARAPACLLQDLAGGCLLGGLAVLDQDRAGRPAAIVGP